MMAGLEGIERNHWGNVADGFYRKLNCNISEVAELEAKVMGLYLVKDNKWKKIILKTNLKIVFKAINEKW